MCDLCSLAKEHQVEFNLEGDPRKELIDLALELRPTQFTLVPVTPKHFRHYDEELLTKQIAESGAPLRIEHMEWVCRRSRLAIWYRRLTLNRLWFTEIWPLRKRVWNYLLKNTVLADKGRGKHVIAVCRREDGEL